LYVFAFLFAYYVAPELLCLVQHIHPEDEQRKVWQHEVQDHEQLVGDRVWQSRYHGDGDA
jgi:hypothetical protein